MVALVDGQDIGAKIERLSASLEKMSNVSAVSGNKAKGTVSYFEQTDEVVSPQYKSINSGNRIRTAQRLAELRDGGYESQFRSMNDFLQGVASGGPRFNEQYKSSFASLMKSMGLNTYEGEHGASLVLPEFAASIMERVRENDLWNRTDNYVVSGNSMTFPKWRETNRTEGNRAGGLSAGWKGEEAAYTKSTPALDGTSLKLNKLTVLVYVTEEMIADSSYVLSQWVSRRVREEIGFKLGDATVRGTGVGQPLGYLNAPGTVSVAKESGQAAATLLSANVLNMWARRDASGDDSGLAWYVNQEIEALLPKLELGTTTNGQLVYMPATALAGAPHATLMGRPVIRTEFNSAAGSVGDIALCDYSKYITIGKGGITETASPHVEFLRDLIAYKFSIRVDGKPCDDSPITPYQGSATQSAFVTLAVRA